MIELKLLIDDLDYEAMIERLMPKAIENADTSELEPWARLLILSKGLNASTISSIVSRMSKEKKDALAVRYINKNRGKIGAMLADMAASRGVKVSIKDLEAKDKNIR